MNFNAFGGFPASLATIPHFAMGPQQASGNFMAIPSHHQSLQIAVSTVDTSQLGPLANGHHYPTNGQLQLQNQMLSSLLGGNKSMQQHTNDGGIFIKTEASDGRELNNEQQMIMNDQTFHQLSGFQQQQFEKNSSQQHQQDFTSLNEYLSRFSGPPTFPFQQMYKYPADLVQTAHQLNNHYQQGNGIDPLLNESSSQSPDLLQSLVSEGSFI